MIDPNERNDLATPVERADAFWRNERRKAPQGHAAAPQAPEAQPRNSVEDEGADAPSKSKGNPDTETRVLVATIALIVILAWALGGHTIWSGTPVGGTR